MPLALERIDHFVLTVADLDATCAFYVRALGMRVETFEPGDGTVRRALVFGSNKINLHQAGREFEPKARTPIAGSGDFCLIASGEIGEIAAALRAAGVEIEEGPVPRTGALGPITSVYFRDPDGNLVEVATQDRA